MEKDLLQLNAGNGRKTTNLCLSEELIKFNAHTKNNAKINFLNVCKQKSLLMQNKHHLIVLKKANDFLNHSKSINK